MKSDQSEADNSRAENRLDGGAGNDTLKARLDASGFQVVEDLTSFHLSNILTGGDGNDSLEAVLSVRASATVTSGSFAENRLDGGAGNDTLKATVEPGSAGASFLNGGSGHDRLTVIGGTGNILEGGGGKDTLIGGSGDDAMRGGDGADVFVFAGPNGHDTVADLERGKDKIDLRAFAADGIHRFSDLHIDTEGGNSVIRFDADNDITLTGVTGLKASDFWFA